MPSFSLANTTIAIEGLWFGDHGGIWRFEFRRFRWLRFLRGSLIDCTVFLFLLSVLRNGWRESGL